MVEVPTKQFRQSVQVGSSAGKFGDEIGTCYKNEQAEMDNMWKSYEPVMNSQVQV